MIDLRIIRNHYNQPSKDDLSFLIIHSLLRFEEDKHPRAYHKPIAGFGWIQV
jgi:hypothetical protein